MTAEDGAFFDGEAWRNDFALDGGGAAEADALASGECAIDFAFDVDGARVNVGGDATVDADGDLGVGEADGALDFAVDEEVFAGGDFAFDYYGGSDARDV